MSAKNPCVLVEDDLWVFYRCTVKSTQPKKKGKKNSPNIAEANFYPPGAKSCESIDEIRMSIGGEEKRRFAVREIKFNPPIDGRATWEYAFTIEERGNPEKFTACDVQCRFSWKK